MSVTELEHGHRAPALHSIPFRVVLAASAMVIGGCGGDGEPAEPSKADADTAADAAGDSGQGGGHSGVEEGWAMYGYDLANTQSYPEPTRLTAERVKDLGPRWRIRVGAGATGTPVVVDGVAYFGAWDGFFYAVDSATGALKWKRALGRQFVRSTPLVADERIYVAVDRSLAALSVEDGEVLFQKELIAHPQGFIESSPKLASGVIVLGLASFELNLTKDDYSFEGAVVGVDAQDGTLLWRVPVTGQEGGICTGGSGVSVWSSAAIDPELGLAYIGTGQTYEEPASTCNDSLLAIHYKRKHEGERIAWKATYTKEDVYVAAGSGLDGLDHDIGAAPNLFRAGDVDAVGAGDKGGTYRAFDRATGEPLWRTDLMTSALAQLGGVMTTAAVQDGTIFVTSNSWGAFGFVVSGEHAAEDTSTLYALNAKTGKVRWSVQLDAPVFGTFAVAGDVLFHASIRGDLYARATADGEQLWTESVGGPVGSGLSLTHDALYVSSGFSIGGPVEVAQVTAFGLNPKKVKDIDLREDTFRELDAEQCEEALVDLQPDAGCRTCLCECDASASGACQAGCWDQAACVLEYCSGEDFGDGVLGMACYEEHCTGKLLPPNVYQESLRSAGCVIACADSCSF